MPLVVRRISKALVVPLVQLGQRKPLKRIGLRAGPQLCVRPKALTTPFRWPPLQHTA